MQIFEKNVWSEMVVKMYINKLWKELNWLVTWEVTFELLLLTNAYK